MSTRASYEARHRFAWRPLLQALGRGGGEAGRRPGTSGRGRWVPESALRAHEPGSRTTFLSRTVCCEVCAHTEGTLQLFNMVVYPFSWIRTPIRQPHPWFGLSVAVTGWKARARTRRGSDLCYSNVSRTSKCTSSAYCAAKR